MSEFRMKNRIIIKAIETAPTPEVIPMLEEDIFPFLMLNNSIIKSALHGREQTSTASP
jgi:hypothetical protein